MTGSVVLPATDAKYGSNVSGDSRVVIGAATTIPFAPARAAYILCERLVQDQATDRQALGRAKGGLEPLENSLVEPLGRQCRLENRDGIWFDLPQFVLTFEHEEGLPHAVCAIDATATT